jgi:alkylation response protein AidB-like acyl-CoA dehydrogenase
MGCVDFAEPEEHRALRAAVAGIAAKFGPRYYAERAAARRPRAELWQALGDAGFIGVNIPEEYGGGGGGLTEPYWGLARLLRIAPVSREMILNYAAQHSLGLPRSY